MFLELDPYYTAVDSAQRIVTAGYNLDYLSVDDLSVDYLSVHDLPDMWFIFPFGRRELRRKQCNFFGPSRHWSHEAAGVAWVGEVSLAPGGYTRIFRTSTGSFPPLLF